MSATPERKGSKAPLIIVLLAIAAYGIYQFALKDIINPPSIEQTIYSAYGQYNENSSTIGVFRIEDANPDYTKTIWYRTYLSEARTPTQEVGIDLFSYPRLKRLFSNSKIGSVFLCYCYNQTSGDYDKVLMASVTRKQFEAISESSYKSEYFYRYVTVVEADKRHFSDIPQ